MNNTKIITKLIGLSSLILLGGAGCIIPNQIDTTVSAPQVNPAPNMNQTDPAPLNQPPSSTAVTSSVAAVLPLGGDALLNSNKDDGTHLQLFHTNSKAYYFRREPDGLGGYIIFDFITGPLIRLNLITGERTNVSIKEPAVAQDVSADDKLVAFVSSFDRDPKNLSKLGIIILDQVSGLEKFYPIVLADPYTSIGMVKFSPNGAQVAFAAAVGDPDHEAGAVYTLDLASGKVTEVTKTKLKNNTYFIISGWKNDGQVDYQ